MKHNLVSLVHCLLLVAMAPVIDGACPRDCSGHGVCSVENKCLCDDGYHHAADCSLSSCPSSTAWTGKPHGNDTTISHIYLLSAVIWAYVIENLVCVNVSRVMKGQACQRSISYCGEHGFPMTMADIYSVYSTEMFYNTLQIVTMADRNATYSNWEADKNASLCMRYGIHRA